MAIFISLIISLTSIGIAVAIRKGYLDSHIEVYKLTRDNKEEEIFSNKIRSYLANSFYVLSFIVMILGIIIYSGHKNNMVILVMVLIGWFVSVLVGVQLIDKNN